jgi:hypothetical protein
MSNLQLRVACDQFITGALRSYVEALCAKHAAPYRNYTHVIKHENIEIVAASITGMHVVTYATIYANGQSVIHVPRFCGDVNWQQLNPTLALQDIVNVLEQVELIIRVYQPL